jgi:hypothetical protein
MHMAISTHTLQPRTLLVLYMPLISSPEAMSWYAGQIATRLTCSCQHRKPANPLVWSGVTSAFTKHRVCRQGGWSSAGVLQHRHLHPVLNVRPPFQEARLQLALVPATVAHILQVGLHPAVRENACTYCAAYMPYNHSFPEQTSPHARRQ